MIRYHLYRNCFPLLALGRYRAALGFASIPRSIEAGAA
ncbi:MAG: hypothetical protein ACJ79W_20580 [Myxococcales bacterium]